MKTTATANSLYSEVDFAVLSMFAGYFFAEGDRLGLSPVLPPIFGTPDREGSFQAEGVTLLEQRRFNGRASRDRQVPVVCPHSGTVLAFWGRLDNRSALVDQLPAQGATAAATDAELVLAAWRCWGEALPDRLVGDFSLALYSPSPRRLFLVRDPLGVKPLYYSPQGEGQQGKGVVFATSVAALRAMSGLHLTPDPEWIARYLVRLSMSDRRTAYQAVVKLPPGHSLLVDADGRTQLRRYHHWRDDAPAAARRDPRWVDAYRSVLEEAIRCRMESDFPLGTENSGGLDSATVTAYLAHFFGVPGDRLHSFSLAMFDQEPALILETSQAAGIGHNYIITGPCGSNSHDDALDRTLSVLGYPAEHGSGSAHVMFYRECQRRDIRTLFSGFGGDEVVTNAGHLLRYELLDQQNYRHLWEFLAGHPLRRSLALAKAVLRGYPSPDYHPDYWAARQAQWPHQLLRPEVVEQFNLRHEYLEAARHDAPYRRINDFILKGLLSQPYIATRLETCTLMAASYGIDYRWPLWDVRLVQQYLATPSLEKAGPQGMGRYLHRRAVEGIVPHRVAWKPSKAMGNGLQGTFSPTEGLMAIADETRGWEATLHPTLLGLIDRPKLQRQIDQAAQGQGNGAFAYSFQRSLSALYWLDRWLRSATQ